MHFNQNPIAEEKNKRNDGGGWGGTHDRSSSKDNVRANAMHQRNSAAYAGCTQAYGGALVVVVKGAGRNLE